MLKRFECYKAIQKIVAGLKEMRRIESVHQDEDKMKEIEKALKWHRWVRRHVWFWPKESVEKVYLNYKDWSIEELKKALL